MINRPTIMSKEDSIYVTAWRDRFAAHEAEARKLSARARADLEIAVKILKNHGAKRIFLFGSLCSPGRFGCGSDIDIAVEGIPSQHVVRAAADLMMAMDWMVDLKPLEEVDEFFRSAILDRGELIYAE